jgi:hypothetical protein
MLFGKEMSVPLLGIEPQFSSPAYNLVTVLIEVLNVRIVNFHLQLGLCFNSGYVAVK